MIVFAFATVAGACDYRKPRTSATFGIDDKHTWLMDAFPLEQSGQAACASARQEAARAPLGFPLHEPASLCFKSGKIILYGTTRQPNRKPAAPSGFGRIGLCSPKPRVKTPPFPRFPALT